MIGALEPDEPPLSVLKNDDRKVHKWLYQRLLGKHIDVLKLFECLVGEKLTKKVPAKKIRNKFWTFFLRNVYPDIGDIDVENDQFMIPARNPRHQQLNENFFSTRQLDLTLLENILKQLLHKPEETFMKWVQKHAEEDPRYSKAIKASTESPPSVHPEKEEVDDDVKEEVDDDEDITDHDDATNHDDDCIARDCDDGSMDADADEEIAPQQEALLPSRTPPRSLTRSRPTHSPPTRSPPRKRHRKTRSHDFRSADDRNGRSLSSGGAEAVTQCVDTNTKVHFLEELTSRIERMGWHETEIFFNYLVRQWPTNKEDASENWRNLALTIIFYKSNNQSTGEIIKE